VTGTESWREGKSQTVKVEGKRVVAPVGINRHPTSVNPFEQAIQGKKGERPFEEKEHLTGGGSAPRKTGGRTARSVAGGLMPFSDKPGQLAQLGK